MTTKVATDEFKKKLLSEHRTCDCGIGPDHCERCGRPWPCPMIDLLNQLEAATRVISAVQARRVADAEYDHAGDDYVRGKIKADALGVAYYACKRAREAEDAALAEWEKVSGDV